MAVESTNACKDIDGTRIGPEISRNGTDGGYNGPDELCIDDGGSGVSGPETSRNGIDGGYNGPDESCIDGGFSGPETPRKGIDGERG